MAHVLVTGASGFIGSHLVAALRARGDDVTCLVRKTSDLRRIEPLGVELAYGDVTEPESLTACVPGHQTVYHLASRITALYKHDYFRVNEAGSANVAEACARQANPPVLAIVSSLAAAGPAPRGRLRTEADPLTQISAYGQSKRAGEVAAARFADRVPITIVRPPIVFGEADRTSVAWFQCIQRSSVHFVPLYWPYRFSLIHAADLCDLVIRAADRGTRLAARPPDVNSSPPPGYYFADCGEHPTYYRIGRIVGDALGRPTLTIAAPAAVGWVVGAVSELHARIRHQATAVNIDKIREACAGSWACSAQLAAAELGFAPAKPLSQRMKQTAQWFRQEGWL